MLLQQNAKYIIKSYGKIKKGKTALGFFEYFNLLKNLGGLRSSSTSVSDFMQLPKVLTDLKALSVFCIDSTMTKLASSKARTATPPWIAKTWAALSGVLIIHTARVTTTARNNGRTIW